ncbi:MAG: hypothetical protein HGA85_05030, partial [Nanoarchaeota archaeon]|nr:hypothetical protein [Nanoarchaeota archaeon]
GFPHIRNVDLWDGHEALPKRAEIVQCQDLFLPFPRFLFGGCVGSQEILVGIRHRDRYAFLADDLIQTPLDLKIEFAEKEVVSALNSFSSGNVPIGLECLPYLRQGVLSRGCRTLKFMLEYPESIYVLSGAGIVHANERKSLSLSRPLFDSPVSSHYTMGTTHVAREGFIVQEQNMSPFGAYLFSQVVSKVENSQTELDIVAYGKHSDSRCGWLVYRLPKNVLTFHELLRLDLTLPFDKLGSHAFSVISSLFGDIKNKYHEKGKVHQQIHPGNLYAHYVSGHFISKITDFSTLEYMDTPQPFASYSGKRDLGIEKTLSSCTPAEKMMILDLNTALRNCNLPDMAEDNQASMPFSEALVNYCLGLTDAAVCSYLGINATFSISRGGIMKDLFMRHVLTYMGCIGEHYSDYGAATQSDTFTNKFDEILSSFHFAFAFNMIKNPDALSAALDKN